MSNFIFSNFLDGYKDIFGENYTTAINDYVNNSSIAKQFTEKLLDTEKYFGKEVEYVNFYDNNNYLSRVESKTIADSIESTNEYEFDPKSNELSYWKQHTPMLDIEFNNMSKNAHRICNVVNEKLKVGKNAYEENQIIDNYFDDGKMVYITKTCVDPATDLLKFQINTFLDKISSNRNSFSGIEYEYTYNVNGIIKRIITSKVIYCRLMDGEFICIDREYIPSNDEEAKEFADYIYPKFEPNELQNTVQYYHGNEKANLAETYRDSKKTYNTEKSELFFASSKCDEETTIVTDPYNKNYIIAKSDYFVKAQSDKISSIKFGFSDDVKDLSINKNAFFKNVYRSNMLGKNWLVDNQLRSIENKKEDKISYPTAGSYFEVDENYCIKEEIFYPSDIIKNDFIFYCLQLLNKENRVEYEYRGIAILEK